MIKTIFILFAGFAVSGCDQIHSRWNNLTSTPFARFSSCTDKWKVNVEEEKAKFLCFEQHSSIGTERSKLNGTMNRPDNLFLVGYGVKPEVINGYKAYVQVSTVEVAFTNKSSAERVSYEFKCEFKIMEPLSSNSVLCGNEDVKSMDLVNEYKNESLWDFTWSIGEFRAIRLEDDDFFVAPKDL